jgi:FkbM family methyltransferase
MVMKYADINTPIGLITVLKNDHFYHDMKHTNQYAEQIILDNELKPYIVNATNILDIGAHVGYHSIAYMKMNPDVKIIAFEPQSEMYMLLQKNIEQNGYTDRIQVYNNVVGHSKMSTTLSDYIDDGPTTTIPVNYDSNDVYNFGGLNIGKGSIGIDMITVDSLNVSNVDYMKIDVEGAESLVLLGAEQTIRKFKPVICFEDLKQLSMDPSELGLTEIPSPYDILRSYGYNNFQQIAYSNVIATIHE